MPPLSALLFEKSIAQKRALPKPPSPVPTHAGTLNLDSQPLPLYDISFMLLYNSLFWLITQSSLIFLLAHDLAN